MYIYIYIEVYISKYIYIYNYVCIYIYIYNIYAKGNQRGLHISWLYIQIGKLLNISDTH